MIKEQNADIKFTDHYKKMWKYVKPYLFRAILAVLLAIPIGALDSVVALALKPFMDSVMIEKKTEVTIMIPFLIVAFTVLQGILNYITIYLNSWVGTKITQDLKRDLYKKLLSMDMSFFDISNSGIILQRFSADADVACNGLLDNFRLFVARLFSSLSLIGVLLYNSWQLSIIALVVLCCALFPLAQVRRRIKGVTNKSVLENSMIVKNYNETYAGAKVIAAYNLQQSSFDRFEMTLKRLFSLSMSMVKKTAWMTPVMHIVVSIGIASVVGYGSYLITTNVITPGNFVSFVTALILLYGPIKSIGKNFNAVQVSFLAIERVSDILEMEAKIVNKENALKISGLKKNIKFKNVCFEYALDVPVIKNISFTADAGKTIALVGNSGGGKSTVVSFLTRFYDIKNGSIEFDGVDIRDIDINSLRDNISLVLQDNFLFDGTIRENVALAKPNATDEEIFEALKNVYLDDFVKEQELGLDTPIGERGNLLSGGQKQRLGIARAFIKNAPIVILDEATSALDNKSESVVQKAIENLMKDRTVFVIAHRLSTIQNADNILLINHGEVVEQGTHEELLKRENGAYLSLYNAQFK